MWNIKTRSCQIDNIAWPNVDIEYGWGEKSSTKKKYYGWWKEKRKKRSVNTKENTYTTVESNKNLPKIRWMKGNTDGTFTAWWTTRALFVYARMDIQGWCRRQQRGELKNRKLPAETCSQKVLCVYLTFSEHVRSALPKNGICQVWQ